MRQFTMKYDVNIFALTTVGRISAAYKYRRGDDPSLPIQRNISINMKYEGELSTIATMLETTKPANIVVKPSKI